MRSEQEWILGAEFSMTGRQDAGRDDKLSEVELLVAGLRGSLDRQQSAVRSTIVLNPVENFPFPDDLAVVGGPLHGFYNTDKIRTREERIATDLQFSGRQAMEFDSRQAYSAWATALGAADATLRLLSGLHAHTVLFMSVARPGQRVLLLPVEAGGHVSAQPILERLGLRVIPMAIDDEQMCVDMDRTQEICEDQHPDFIFVDRSEGLVVEDFSALTRLGMTSIFDASHYLCNIIAGDHPNPFLSGFDLVVSSLHKNFPGPQKALLATRLQDNRWKELLRGVSTYVSNMHMTSTYAATLTLGRADWLRSYSKRMLTCAVLLEKELVSREVPAVRRPSDMIATHHVWIREIQPRRAFRTTERLEQCGILTNYRKLPYSLGYGVRLGLSAAVRVGLLESDIPHLADLIAEIRRSGASPALRQEVGLLSQAIWKRVSL